MPRGLLMLLVWMTGLAVFLAFMVLAGWQFKVACDQDPGL